jgi:hypothetical protein
MKKTLSILLSLLMVLGTITCMFTVPVTTASAEEAATPTVEALPVTDFISYPDAKTITPESKYTLNKVDFPLGTNYGVRGWEGVARKGEDGLTYDALIDADGNYVYPETAEHQTNDNKRKYKHDAEGNYYNAKGEVIKDPYDSRISSKVLYQMTFDVTVSEDVNSDVKLYPVFHSNDSVNWGFDTFVGIRNESGSAAAETAYNYGKIAAVSDKHTNTITADKAATIVAGKTYSYTYLFALVVGSDYINNIAITADGLTQGSVTVSNPKIFPYSETDATNFLRKEEAVYKKDENGNDLKDEKGNKIFDHYTAVVIPYAVEENGNVFIRMYGYRDIGSDSQVKRTVSAALGGEYYNMMIEGGSKYELSFDARYTSEQGFHDDDKKGRSPAFDFFETGALDYTAAYASIKNAEDTYNFKKSDSYVNKQREYGNTKNGYSYFWTNSGSETVSRRIKNNIATLAYYDATGKELGKKSQGYGSQSGRTFKNTDGINSGEWIKGVYALDAIGAQSVLEASQAEPTNAMHGNMRYHYADGQWVYNSARKNIYAEAEQNVTVALGIDYIYAGSTYDFDNFTIKGSKVCDGIIEYKNKAGEVIELPASETPAVVIKDTVSGELTIKDYNSDAFTFEGWYVNGEFASANDTIIVGLTDTVKAVIVYENYAATQGSFENYTTSVKLNQYVSTTGGTKNYTVKTGEFVDGEWAMWDKWAKADAAETDEFLAKYPYLTKTGGLNSSVGSYHVFSQVGATDAIAKEPEGDKYYTVNPYRGNTMLKLTAYARQAVTKISGLQAGKTYTVSFVNWAPTQHDYVKTAFAVDNPIHLDQSQITDYKVGNGVVVDNLGYILDISAPTEETVRTWRKITYNFVAKDSYAYLAFSVCNIDKYMSPCYIDDLVVVEYDCKGNHIYDDHEDTSCNVCGEARVYPTSWDFEDGSMENIDNGTGTIKVVDAADQPAKIGSKYLEYTSNGWTGITFNFPYEQGYKYTISYDFKIFEYGTGKESNGIDGVLLKYDDGVYGSKDQGAANLNPGSENIVTRYWEDGTVYEKVTGFTQENNNYCGRQSKDGVYLNAMSTSYGPAAIWDGWQHFEIEVGSNNDHEGLVEYGIRGNDAGWVLGIDNFKVEKIALTTINEVDDATNGTTTFNIRARTADKKQGLRFKSTIDLDKLNLSDGAKIVEYGTLAMKAELLTQGFILDRRAAKDKTPAGHVVAGVAYSEADKIDVRYALDETTNTLTYTGVLTGIGVKNYDVDFAVRGYAIVELADGTRTTVYDDVYQISVYDAAQQIVKENQNEDDVTIAQKVIELYDAIQ